MKHENVRSKTRRRLMSGCQIRFQIPHHKSRRRVIFVIDHITELGVGIRFQLFESALTVLLGRFVCCTRRGLLFPRTLLHYKMLISFRVLVDSLFGCTQGGIKPILPCCCLRPYRPRTCGREPQFPTHFVKICLCNAQNK